MAITGIYVSAFASVLGEQVRLEELEDDGLRRHLAALYDQGIKYCRVSESSVTSLATASGQQTMLASNGADVGAIVFCTDTPAERTPTHQVWDILRTLEMPMSRAVVTGGSGCGNLGPGLSAARGLILLDDIPAVLLVTADRIRGRTRYVANGQTVMSDGAASCIVSSHMHGPSFALRGLASSLRADIGTIAEQRMMVARETVAAIAHTVHRAIEPLSLDSADFRYLVTGNYGRISRELIGASAGIRAERIYCPSLAQAGHCFAADPLVGLGSLLETGQIADGDHVMLLTSSPISWTVAILRCALQDAGVQADGLRRDVAERSE